MLRILASSASRVRLRLGSRELGPTACLSLFLLLASASVECMFDSSLSLVLLLGIHLPDCSSSRSGNANPLVPVVLCCRCHCTMVFHALSLTRSFQKGRKGAREQGRQSARERERRSYSNFRCFCCILIPVSLQCNGSEYFVFSSQDPACISLAGTGSPSALAASLAGSRDRRGGRAAERSEEEEEEGRKERKARLREWHQQWLVSSS